MESEILIKQLLERRNHHLNMLKHLDFRLIMDPFKDEIKSIERLQTTTIDQIKKIEQEVAFLTLRDNENVQ
ncbi:MAG: hypothetical protein WEB01_03410 [Nitrosopumilus sp.]|uniref:hypothetical protein n=2 Tax=Nitrosopumilus sp. TaxID=2024843 RepID=UPI0034A04AE1